MTTHKINITIPKDDDGFIGRECLECEKYFKLKSGTGLPTTHCHCPYCEYEGDQDTFWTQDQIKYAESIAEKIAYEKFINPMLDDLSKSFKRLERSTKSGFLQIKVTEKRDKPFFLIKRYSERELETRITCDNCGLEFAIYGVFSRCPDCKELNAFSIFNKSIEVSKKQFELFQEFQNDKDVVQANLKFILSNSISAFDGLGKELRTKYPNIFPVKPKNLFQNIDELNKTLSSKLGISLTSEIVNYEFIRTMFQVRHILEHNMGVVDADIIRKVPSLASIKGRKYKLVENDIETFIDGILNLAGLIEEKLKNHNT
jgi:Zn ribbon nucleic-acid-binding protein